MFFVILDHLGVALINLTILVLDICYYLVIPYILYRLYDMKVPHQTKLRRKAKRQLKGEIRRVKKEGVELEQALELYGKSDLGEAIIYKIYA